MAVTSSIVDVAPRTVQHVRTHLNPLQHSLDCHDRSYGRCGRAAQGWSRQDGGRSLWLDAYSRRSTVGTSLCCDPSYLCCLFLNLPLPHLHRFCGVTIFEHICRIDHFQPHHYPLPHTQPRPNFKTYAKCSPSYPTTTDATATIASTTHYLHSPLPITKHISVTTHFFTY